MMKVCVEQTGSGFEYSTVFIQEKVLDFFCVEVKMKESENLKEDFLLKSREIFNL